MSDEVDSDTEAAVVALWQTTAALMAVCDVPQTGRLHSTQAAPKKSPYATVQSESAGQERFAGGRKDKRKVTIAIRGPRAQVVAVQQQALGVFNADMGNQSKTPTPPGLVYPSKARFLKWFPTDDGTIKEEEKTQVQGGEVWRTEITATVWSVRTP